MNPNLPEYTCNHPKLLYLEIWITFVIPTLKKNEYAEKKVGNWHSTFNNNAPKLHTTEPTDHMFENCTLEGASAQLAMT